MQEVNTAQPGRFVDKLEQALGGSIAGMTVACSASPSKPAPADFRGSQALAVARELLLRGAVLRSWDPSASVRNRVLAQWPALGCCVLSARQWPVPTPWSTPSRPHFPFLGCEPEPKLPAARRRVMPSTGRTRPGKTGACRVLIVGINYRPESAGIAPYTTGLAEHLVRSGLQVTVLAGMPSYPEWKVYAGYERRLAVRERVNGVTAYRLAHHVPARPTAAGRGLYELSFFLHGLRGLVLPRPDTVLGVVPALSGGALARLFAARFGVPYGLLFQDLMGPAAAQSGTPGGGTVSRTTGALERWVVSEATGVAAISRGFFPYLRALGVPNGRLVHLPNWSHVPAPHGDRGATRRELGWGSDEQIVLHAGNMGVKQALEQVIATARLATETSAATRFVFLGQGNQRARLEALAGGVSCSTSLTRCRRTGFRTCWVPPTCCW